MKRTSLAIAKFLLSQIWLVALRHSLIKDNGSKGIFIQDNRNGLGSTKVIQALKVDRTLFIYAQSSRMSRGTEQCRFFRNVAYK